MRIILVCLSVLGLVSCAAYPYRGNYYGNNRYVTTPYYGGYSGYGVSGGYGGGYRSGYRDHDDFGGGNRGGYGGGFGGGGSRGDGDGGFRGGDRR